jgi:hypothetical protein
VIAPIKHTGRLFKDYEEPPFIRRKIAIDYKEIKSKSDNLDIDDERYDVPTFLRKQAD